MAAMVGNGLKGQLKTYTGSITGEQCLLTLCTESSPEQAFDVVLKGANTILQE